MVHPHALPGDAVTLFSMICDSCAAKLQVKNASAIGQTLACPKCGTMLKVTPPVDWQPPPELNLPDTVSSSFDDIDRLLEKTRTEEEAIREVRRVTSPGRAESRWTVSSKQTPLPTPSPSHAGGAGSDTSGRSRKPTPSAAGDEGPLLPTEQWTSPEIQQKKKRVAIVASIIGGVVLLGAAGVAFWGAGNGRSGKGDSIPSQLAQKHTEESSPVAEGTSDLAASQSSSEKGGPSPPAPQPDRATDRADTPSESASNTGAETGTEAGSKTDPALPPALPNVPPLIPDGPKAKTGEPDLAPTADKKPNPVIAAPGSPVNPAPSPDGPQSPVSPKNHSLDETLGGPLGHVDGAVSELGQLSELLQEAGTSLGNLYDVAESNRDMQLIGIAKYFIERPEPGSINVAKQLALPCGGIRYSGVRRTTVLNDVMVITGVPITLDTQAILASGHPLNPEVNLNEKETDFGELIKTIFAPEGLGPSEPSDAGVTIGLLAPEQIVKKTYSLAPLSGKNDSSLRLVALIKSLFSPESWVREANRASISLVGDDLVVSNDRRVQYDVQQLLAKRNAAIGLLQDHDSEAARQTLVTRWESASAALQKKLKLETTVDRTLIDLLERVSRETGVTLLVDWEALHRLGWTPRTIVPGSINEPTIESLLRELARSMKLTVRAIDATTLELTSFEKAATTPDLEVYSFHKILSGPLNEKQALRLVYETLGPQLQGPHVRYVYDPECQCLIVFAPQSLQRQLASIVRQLEQL